MRQQIQAEISQFRACAKSYFFISFGNNDPWPAKASPHLWIDLTDSLRWGVSASPLLQSPPAQETPYSASTPYSTQQPLQRWRNAAGPALSDDSRTGTDRNRATVAPEWCLSVSHRPAELSRRNDTATFFAARCPRRTPTAASVARPVSSAHDDHAAPPYTTYFRRRLHRACRLRSTRAGAARLQPNQARAPLLSPAALFRGPEQGLLARRVAAGRCSYCQRNVEPAYRVLGEDSQRSPVGHCPRRQRILRSRADRVAGGAAGGLRHRRPPDRPDQTQVGAPALRKPQPRSRGGRVPLPAHPVASPLPLRRHPTAAARGARRTTDAVQVGQVSLPGPGYESALATAQPLALLQRPCRRRTPHQTTQRGLCSGKHPHAPLLRERDLLPFAAARLQPRQLVQAALLARRVTERHPSDPASPYPFDAGPTASHRQPAAFALARKWSPRGSLEICAPANQQTQAVKTAVFHAGFKLKSTTARLLRTQRVARGQSPPRLSHPGGEKLLFGSLRLCRSKNQSPAHREDGGSL